MKTKICKYSRKYNFYSPEIHDFVGDRWNEEYLKYTT